MEALGYGEDGLTFRYLIRDLADFLSKVRVPSLTDGPDPSDPADCLLFYRPSFGRRGGPRSPIIGEFDAIVATAHAVYLIESKWNPSPAPVNNDPILEWHQQRRHEVFRCIRAAWNADPPDSWDAFYQRHPEGLGGKLLAAPDRRLATNMAYVLRRLQSFPALMLDILLYFHRADADRVNLNRVVSETRDTLTGFQIVKCQYETVENSGYFRLAGDSEGAP